MDFKDLINSIISNFITPAIGLIFSAAVVFFLWNMMEVIRKSDQPEELAKFKSKAVWGIVAIAVMASMWGLVNFVTVSFRPNTTPPNVPNLNNPVGTFPAGGGVQI